MEYRMKTHQLTNLQIEDLLKTELVGTLATVDGDGTPYVTPMHFVFSDNRIYMHGLPKGQKISNIMRNDNVCFNVYKMQGLLLDDNNKPCDTNTEYQSVIIKGKISTVNDFDNKSEILCKIIKKYTPQYAATELPENMINGTCVLPIDISEITGKYYN